MTAIVLQARVDSSRLPGKSLLPLDGKPVVVRVMEALNNVPADLRILACPEDSYSAFAPLVEETGFRIHTGPKEDVLERYCQVIRAEGIKRVIRATADNPFVFADAASALNAEAMALNADYSGYSGIPVGAGVESVCGDALLRAGEKAVSPYDREHVCPYLYTNPDLFRLHRPLAPLRWQASDIRITIDTQEDYENAVKLFAALKYKPYRHYGYVIIAAYRELFSSSRSS
ncbi:MAG: spore coat protein [Treponema sp.]|nr:spore coat protein [Treponema sp.]